MLKKLLQQLLITKMELLLGLQEAIGNLDISADEIVNVVIQAAQLARPSCFTSLY